MLRHKVGETMFFDILKSYASNDSLSYNAASTSDFQKVCEDISGLDFEQFFQQWIYGEGILNMSCHGGMREMEFIM